MLKERKYQRNILTLTFNLLDKKEKKDDENPLGDKKCKKKRRIN